MILMVEFCERGSTWSIFVLQNQKKNNKDSMHVVKKLLNLQCQKESESFDNFKL